MRRCMLGILVSCHLIGLLAAGVPLGRIWERADMREGAQANRFCKYGDAFYAVGNGGSVWRKPDGGDWSAESTCIKEDLNGIVQANGTMVAVGAGGRILRKPAGGLWGVQVSGVSRTLRSVTYGGGWFVAVGDGGTIVRSAEGVHWSVWASGVTKHLYDIIWDGIMFRAVGQTYTILSATPGGDWLKLAHFSGYNEDYKSIASGGGVYVINGTKYSTDAVTWTDFALLNPVRNDVAFGAGVFVIAGNSGEVLVSSNGSQWTSIQTSSSENLVSVEWTGAEFVALTAARTQVVSVNGYRWRSKGLFPASLSLQDGCWDGGQYVVVGDKQAIYTSPDGRWWTTEQSPVHGALNAACSGGGRVVAVGDESAILSTTDGRTWQKVAIPGYWNFYDVCWTGTKFVAVGTDGIMMDSVDGLSWTMSTPGRLDAVTWDGNRFLAFSGRNLLQSANGNDWQPIASVPWFVNSTSHDEMIHDLIWTGTFYIAVGDYGWILRSPDGLTWTRSTSPSAASYSNGLHSVVWSGSRFVATGRENFAYSSDGLNWTMIPQGGTNVYSDVAWNGSLFMAVWGTTVKSSSDGISWTVLYTLASASLKSITWSGSDWVMAGSNLSNAFVATSPNGLSWTPVNGDAGATYYSVTSAGGVHVAIDWKGKVKRFSGGSWTDEPSLLAGTPVSLVVEGTVFRAFDNYGMSSRRGTDAPWVPGDQRVTKDSLHSVTSNDGKWVIGTQGWYGSEASIMTTADGRNWVKETFGGYQGPFVSSVWTGTEFQVVGGNCVYSSTTGSNWTPQATSQWSSGEARCMVRYNNESIIGGYSSGAAIWVPSGADHVRIYKGSSTIQSLVAGPSEVLAIGTNDTLVSQDGRAWSILEPKPRLATNLLDVIHTPLGFFAVGDGGIVLQSPDGESWNRLQASDTLQLNALAWGGGKLVAAGSGLLHSINGQQWSAGGISSIPAPFTDVVWGGDRFVAVSNGFAGYSLDGVTWQSVSVPGSLNSVLWTGTAFLAGTADGMVFRSVDGSSWALQVLPGDLVSITCGNGIWMAGTSTGNAYLTQDGVNWSLAFDAAKQGFSATNAKARYAGGRFFYFHSNAAFHSANGTTWTRFSQVVRDMVWTGTQFVGNGDNGLIARSANGTTWTYGSSGRTGVPAASVWTGSQIIGVGSAGKAYSSTDGITWAAITTGTTRALVDVAWTGTQTVILDSLGSLIFLDTGTPLPGGVVARDLFSAGGLLLAACDSGKIARLEATGWNVVDTGAGTRLNGIADNGSSLMAVGGSGTVLNNTSVVGSGTWSLETRSAWSSGMSAKMSVVNGALASCGSDGKIKTSSNGKIWDPWYAPTTTALNAAEKVDGDLLVFGNLGKILRIHPTSAVVSENSGTTATLRSVANSGTRLVAVGDSGTILLSKSGSEVPLGYDRWIADLGASESQLQPDGDFDQDGVGNIIAYLHGFPSSGSDDSNERNRLPAMTTSLDGPTLVFEINPDYQDVEIKVLKTFDFITWSEIAQKTGAGAWSGTALVTESPAAEGRKQVEVADLSLPPPPGEFYRLSVSRR